MRLRLRNIDRKDNAKPRIFLSRAFEAKELYSTVLITTRKLREKAPCENK
jgi:hypothetical protein